MLLRLTVRPQSTIAQHYFTINHNNCKVISKHKTEFQSTTLTERRNLRSFNDEISRWTDSTFCAESKPAKLQLQWCALLRCARTTCNRHPRISNSQMIPTIPFLHCASRRAYLSLFSHTYMCDPARSLPFLIHTPLGALLPTPTAYIHSWGQ